MHHPAHLVSGAVTGSLLLLACGSSSPTEPSTKAELRVMTFNIQHGINGAGKYDLKYAAQTIAKVNPDLVGVQELTRNHASYDCDDQPARIAEMLTASTGRPWSPLYQQEWFTQNRECQSGGRGDGPETEGIGFFAPEPIGTPALTQLWNGRLGVMTMMHRGADVPVIVTHLAAQTTGQSDRLRQLEALIPWTLSRPGNGAKILLGDFNSSPGTPEYDQVTAHYRDAWTDGVAAGTARGRMDGITHKSSRIDYIFYIAGDALELKSVENVDTRALMGVDASDHNPLVATFAIK